MAEPVGRRRRHDDALRVDHLAHHTTRAVRRTHQHRIQPDLLRSDSLQAAEQHVGCGIRPGDRHSQPTQQRAKERIENSGDGKCQPHCGVGARVARQRAKREHRRDGDQRIADFPDRVTVDVQQAQRAVLHRKSCNYRRDQDARPRRGEPIEDVHSGFLGRRGHDGRDFFDYIVQAFDREAENRHRVERGLDQRNAPGEHENRQDDPRHPGQHHGGAVVALENGGARHRIGLADHQVLRSARVSLMSLERG